MVKRSPQRTICANKFLNNLVFTFTCLHEFVIYHNDHENIKEVMGYVRKYYMNDNGQLLKKLMLACNSIQKIKTGQSECLKTR